MMGFPSKYFGFLFYNHFADNSLNLVKILSLNKPPQNTVINILTAEKIEHTSLQ